MTCRSHGDQTGRNLAQQAFVLQDQGDVRHLDPRLYVVRRHLGQVGENLSGLHRAVGVDCKGHGTVRVQAGDTDGAVVLKLDELGNGNLSVLTKKGSFAGDLGVDTNGNGQPAVRFKGGKNAVGNGQLYSRRQDGKDACHLSIDQLGHGRLALLAEDQIAAALGADEKGNGILNVRDDSGTAVFPDDIR